MEYLKQEDYEYILGKYHEPTNKPTDRLNRFIRRDELFAPETGLSSYDLQVGLLANDEKYAERPHAVRLARATEFILSNTRISCDCRDRFPALNSVDRLLARTLIGQWSSEQFSAKYPAELSQMMGLISSTASAALWPDFDHSVPNWDLCFSVGFTGLKENARKAAEKFASEHPAMTDKEKGFYEAIDIDLAAILHLLDRLADLAEKTSGSERMAQSLRRLQVSPPQTMYDVLMFIYLYFMVSEHVECLQVRSLSNLDRMLYPYYVADLEKDGTEQQAREDIAYFLFQFQAIDNYWGQPVYFGGRNADGTTAINEMSYILLDVYDKMGIHNPKVQLKVDTSTPKAWVRKAMDMIRRGHNSIVFVNQALMEKALIRYGASPDDARMADVRGCYEYAVNGTMDSGMNYLNLVKPLEFAMNGGHDMRTGQLAGLETPMDFATFDEFFAAYKEQLTDLIERCRLCVNGFEGFLDEIHPQPLLASTFAHCLETAKEPYGGGAATNNSNMMFGFIANAADSLASIRKYVYEDKRLTLPEFREILLHNWEGHELFRREVLARSPHYGNNDDRADLLAVEIVNTASNAIIGKPNARGGFWVCGAHVARQSYDQGVRTAATPDGRLAGEELSKNISASMGSARSGVTAEVLSATKLDATTLKGDASIDAGIHPTAVRGEDGLTAMVALLDTFIARGGHAMHINVFDGSSLRDAKAHPEKYPDLQIRVCGWNVMWNNITPVEQDKFILQAEALLG